MLRTTALAGVLFILILGVSAALADVPGLINYQGYLTDPDGYPISDVLDMEFTLWDDQTDTDPSHLKWTETWDTVTEQVEVSDGYYTVLLGSYQPFGTVFEDNGELWLQVEVDAEVMTSRKRVAAVAYAMSAKSADEITFLITGDLIEDGAVTHAKIADGTIQEADLGFSVVTEETDPTVDESVKDGVAFSELSGTATDAQIPNTITINQASYASQAGFAGSATYASNADYLDTLDSTQFMRADTDTGTTGDLSVGGKVGIGTATPSVDLEVDGDVKISGALDAAGLEVRTPISSLPYTISVSGSYYLSQNLSISGATAITVNADDVTIELNGFTLSGDGTGSSAHGIYMNSISNVEIKNGTVNGFGGTGIYASGSTGKNHRVIGVRAIGNGDDGIYVGRNNARVKDCTAEGNVGAGIFVFYGSIVTGSTSYDNGAYGIYADTGSTVTGNTARDNNASGIYAGVGCTVTGNTAHGNYSRGIYASSGCTVIGNTAYGNDGDGIKAGDKSLVKNNTARYNQNYGISLGTNCLVLNNLAFENNQSGGAYEDIQTCPTCATEKGVPITEVPYTISNSGSYYLARDLTSDGTDAITITADHVTLDLNGYSLIGTGAADEDGIYMNARSNVEIRNGTVRGFGGYGIREASISSGRNHRVIGVRAIGNGTTGSYDGINLNGGSHLVKDCAAKGNGSVGIYVMGSSIVTGNLASINGSSGIYASGSTVTGNTAWQNGDDGIQIGGTSLIKNNTTYYNTGNNLTYGSNCIVVDNVAP